MCAANVGSIAAGAPGVQIGSITPYGGDLSVLENLNALQQQGWLLCDGSSYSQKDYPELFAAIGTSSGGANGQFNVPNLQNRFLRGTDRSGKGIDPDANSRVAAASGGATGVNSGSLQLQATAVPNRPWRTAPVIDHTHTTSHLTNSTTQAWYGSTYDQATGCADATVDNSGAHFHELTGFDAATVPVNLSLYYIIKAKTVNPGQGTTPSGTIVATMAAISKLPDSWLPCDGTAYAITRFQNLGNTIGYNFGGDGVSVLNVPNLQGQFLRGTAFGTSLDPDSKSRTASAAGGNTGDLPGSSQAGATGTPPYLATSQAGDHSHNIANIPVNYHNVAAGASGPASKAVMTWTDAATSSTSGGAHTHQSIVGGDRETRPENIYADFLIASDDILQDAPPIGSIVAFGGDTTDPSINGPLFSQGWMPCNGSLQPSSKFAALFVLLGNTFGGDKLKFAVPDLRGLFTIGVGASKLGTRQEKSTTGKPNNSIQTSTDGDHSHTVHNVPNGSHTIDVVMGWQTAESHSQKGPTSVDGAHSHALSGGDSESRPTNIGVSYLIRFK